MVSEEQIQRFFSKQCTAEEAEQVAAWLKAHPDVAAQYLQENEWQLPSANEGLPDDTKETAWYEIIDKVRKRNLHTLLKRSAVAALVIGCMATSFFYVSNKKTLPANIAHQKNEIIKVIPVADTAFNYTENNQRIVMKDSSVVTLSPQSFVWFDTSYNKLRRDIHLHGEARFEVAKNKQKPFTVYSGSFSTTALGTEFTVKLHNGNINVQLMHGKVVIKTTDNNLRNWKDIYLAPGQQMAYNENDETARVSLIKDKKMASAAGQGFKNNTQRETAESLIFNGSDMSTVLQKLHDYYNTEIQFNKSDIKNISFTGVIVKKDSVQNILKVITQMNGLGIEETGAGFIITKEKN